MPVWANISRLNVNFIILLEIVIWSFQLFMYVHVQVVMDSGDHVEYLLVFAINQEYKWKWKFTIIYCYNHEDVLCEKRM